MAEQEHQRPSLQQQSYPISNESCNRSLLLTRGESMSIWNKPNSCVPMRIALCRLF